MSLASRRYVCVRVCASMGVGMCELACEPRACARASAWARAQVCPAFRAFFAISKRMCVRACARSCVRACVQVIFFVCARGCGRACVGEFVGYSCRLSCLLGSWVRGARGRTIRRRTCSGRSQRTSFAADRSGSAGCQRDRERTGARGWTRARHVLSRLACSTRTSTARTARDVNGRRMEGSAPLGTVSTICSVGGAMRLAVAVNPNKPPA